MTEKTTQTTLSIWVIVALIDLMFPNAFLVLIIIASALTLAVFGFQFHKERTNYKTIVLAVLLMLLVIVFHWFNVNWDNITLDDSETILIE